MSEWTNEAAIQRAMRVTLVTIGSRGDVQPFIALGMGSKGRARGHTVRLATHDEFRRLVEEAGIEHRGLPDMASMITAEADTPFRLIRALVRAVDRITPELITRTLSACEDADLVVDTPLCHTEAPGGGCWTH